MTKEQVAVEEIARCRAIIQAKFGIDVNPRVAWDISRSSRVRGYASYSKNLIRLNASVADAVGPEFRQTVGHEFAHIVAYNFYFNHPQFYSGSHRELKNHGRGWKWLMTILGLAPDRISKYGAKADQRPDLTSKTPYKYECGGCGHQFMLSKQVHTKVHAGQVRWHPKCGQEKGRIVFRGIVAVERFSFGAYK